MKVIIAGSRTITDREFIFDILDTLLELAGVTEVVCGCAKGPDLIGRDWAKKNNIPVKYFPPDWNKYGKSAGMYRNCEMGEYSDFLIAFWDGDSTGTKHMMDYMDSVGKPKIHIAYREVQNEAQ